MITETYAFFDVIFSDGSVLGFSSITDVYTYAALAAKTVVAISNTDTLSLTVTELDEELDTEVDEEFAYETAAEAAFDDEYREEAPSLDPAPWTYR